MLTAHRRLNPKPNAKKIYLRGWEIIDANMRVVKVVLTKREAKAIIDAQDINAKP